MVITLVYSKRTGNDIPMLGVIDNGLGMSHSDIQRMVQFGRARPECHDVDHIGRYGIGFKVIGLYLN